MDQPFQAGEVEHGAVVEVRGGGEVAERGVGGPGRRVFGRVPGVEVGVEMEDGDGLAVDLGEGAEGGEGERVVAA